MGASAVFVVAGTGSLSEMVQFLGRISLNISVSF